MLKKAAIISAFLLLASILTAKATTYCPNIDIGDGNGLQPRCFDYIFNSNTAELTITTNSTTTLDALNIDGYPDINYNYWRMAIFSNYSPVSYFSPVVPSSTLSQIFNLDSSISAGDYTACFAPNYTSNYDPIGDYINEYVFSGSLCFGFGGDNPPLVYNGITQSFINFPTSTASLITSNLTSQLSDTGTIGILGVVGGLYILIFIITSILGIFRRKKA